jgi:glycerophosphoryl diester phosphodiesterase
MLRILLFIAGGIAAFILGVVVFNLSLFEAPHREGPPRLIAHRGVHQTFHRENLENDTCTAERIYPPEHDLLENTLPSMDAAFTAGADVVEIDVHLTPDGQFAVMHDWTVDCRTGGEGVTHELPMDYLKSLDLGYGYTADGGATFPLRGKGVGMMPELSEVLAQFPDKSFLINFKSNRVEEGEALAALIDQHPEWRGALWGAYGGGPPTDKSVELIDGLKGYTRRSMMDCLIDYALTGWTGIVPKSCRNTVVLVPSNLAWVAWGWPHKFTKRMEEAGSEVILLGPFESGDIGTRGVDSLDETKAIPEGFGGYVWTNRIELIGPVLKAR